MSSKKLETEELHSFTSFKPLSEAHSSHKKPESVQLQGDKENTNTQNKNSSEKTQSFKPKSIGHYILGYWSPINSSQSHSHSN